MASVLLTVHVLISIALVAMVLLQRTDSDGMGSLGGGNANMNTFLTGRTAANLLTRTTAILAGAFFLTSLALTLHGRTDAGKSILDMAPAAEEPAPAQAAPAQPGKAPAAPENKKEEKPTVPLAH